MDKAAHMYRGANHPHGNGKRNDRVACNSAVSRCEPHDSTSLLNVSRERIRQQLRIGAHRFFFRAQAPRRKQSTAWSLTMPEACIHAYTITGPTNLNPRRLSSFEIFSDNVELVGTGPLF